MKRLFKMLSLLSILLILGSCDSSKRVIALPSEGYVQFTVRFLPYNPQAYRLFSTIIVYDEVTGKEQGFFGKDLIEAKIAKNRKYIVKWRTVDLVNGVETGALPSELFTSTELNTNVEANYITVKLGKGNGQLYPEPY